MIASTGMANDPHIEMVNRACPVCGSTDDSAVFAKADFNLERLDCFAFASRKIPEYMHYRLIECPSCDLLYANPIPPLDLLASAYEVADYDSEEEARFAARTYAKYLPGISSRLPDLNGVLDIGAGDGAFLEQLLDHGFTSVAGIEPSSAPIEAASERARPLIQQGLFKGSDFEEESMSMIT
jgi:SAM-dependent methyltransferase